jgi:DNA-3-methyladenine glycosylase II
MKPKYWNQACEALSKNDPIMREIISRYPNEILKSHGNAFETLFRSIVGQQISVKAAQAIWQKTRLVILNIKPEALLEANPKDLRQAGLSERKILYCKDLAQKFINGQIQPHRWHRLSDQEVIRELIQVKGIGRWTAEMFLIFHLLRPNVFPKEDLGLQKAISIYYKKRYPLSPRQLEIFKKKFSPWSTVATWYLWRALDPVPVEY